ncbi:MAG: YihY/virulence factor BrkB family protein [Flavobacteriia bacterium]|nr:YihY/virulence factor BrkB family protein [Flavobacteriia bacterium]
MKKNWNKFKFPVLKQTFIEFFKENSFVHCAAFSYYTVLTIVPVIYLSFVSFGKIIGQQSMLNIIQNFLKENVGIEDVSGIMSFLDEIDFEKGNIILEIFGLIMLLFSVSALFNTLRFSINEFLDITKEFESKKKAFLAGLKARLISVSLMSFFGLVVILTYFVQTVMISIGKIIFSDFNEFQQILYVIIEHSISITSNIIIFLLIFKYLHDAKVPWTFALRASVFTSIFLYFGQLGIKYYISHYFFARNGGVAGSIFIILIWMYYSSHIIFVGAKYLKVFADFKNKSLKVD